MSDSLYEIYRSKGFALAYTTVIHSTLEAKAQNVFLEQKGFEINHSNPRTWKYYLNLTGQYHDYDKNLISSLNSDAHPYMRIKVAGDNKPIEVDFVKELLTGQNGDYSLAAEYSYGSDYYNELIARYPGCESLILGILNPVDMDDAITAGNGDILYCGGYYRKRLSHIMKETYGFEKREDVTIDAEFLIEDWEQDVIYDLQDYVRDYLKRWEVPDYTANHTYYPSAIRIGMVGGLIPVIEKFRLKNIKNFSTHSFHVREFINSYGYLGEYVDALTREQAMYLYFNMDWLANNKGKNKVLQALIDNLLTPSNIPLVAYNLGHDTWDMQTEESLTPTIEFKKEHLNLDPQTTDVGTTTEVIVKKEEKVARDNGIYVEDQIADIEFNAKYSKFNALKTKVLESDYIEWDMNVFFNLDEFQFHQWIFAASQGNYQGSIFVSHPTTTGRLQLTPKTALILFLYTFTKGYYGAELESCPQLVVRNIPKDKTFTANYLSPYPTNQDLWENVTSDQVTQAKLDQIANFPLPPNKFTSTTDFYNKTSDMFDILEGRRGLAAMESDIFANGELELVVSKFYHLFVVVEPLTNLTYPQWLSQMGLDLSDLDTYAYQRLADELLNAGMGISDTTKKSSARMHTALMNIVRFFLSYTVQLVSKFSKASSRMYGFKTLRESIKSIDLKANTFLDLGVMSLVDVIQDYTIEWWAIIGSGMLENGSQDIMGYADFPLIDLTTEQGTYFEVNKDWNMLGFSASFPDETNGNLPYADPVTQPFASLMGDVLPDQHDITGLNMGVLLTADDVSFLDTLGLEPISPEDFSFTISIEL